MRTGLVAALLVAGLVVATGQNIRSIGNIGARQGSEASSSGIANSDQASVTAWGPGHTLPCRCGVACPMYCCSSHNFMGEVTFDGRLVMCFLGKGTLFVWFYMATLPTQGGCRRDNRSADTYISIASKKIILECFTVRRVHKAYDGPCMSPEAACISRGDECADKLR
jgi:hypothetical protein